MQVHSNFNQCGFTWINFKCGSLRKISFEIRILLFKIKSVIDIVGRIFDLITSA